MRVDIGAGEMGTAGHRPPATALTFYGGDGEQFSHLKGVGKVCL